MRSEVYAVTRVTSPTLSSAGATATICTRTPKQAARLTIAPPGPADVLAHYRNSSAHVRARRSCPANEAVHSQPLPLMSSADICGSCGLPSPHSGAMAGGRTARASMSTPNLVAR